ncbi:MAG: NUDIX hydrolase [Candidatus Gracilibacteria bacterium]|jgi:ADP-ribose pyrophosphatase|nr:NUDIX hydrolase [Candidatus Gracilibacteria bacterium]
MIESWKKIKETPFKAGFRNLLNRVFILPNGKTADFDVMNSGKVACVLALTNEKKIVLASQFRPGPEKILHELPGGCVEKGEEPIDAIQRELLEETGYTGDFEFVGTSLNGAYTTMIKYNFVAKNCKKIQEPQTDDTEFCEVLEMPLEDFRKHLRSGELSDVATGYLGLDHLGLL